jgi:hypothetical protein
MALLLAMGGNKQALTAQRYARAITASLIASLSAAIRVKMTVWLYLMTMNAFQNRFHHAKPAIVELTMIHTFELLTIHFMTSWGHANTH